MKTNTTIVNRYVSTLNVGPLYYLEIEPKVKMAHAHPAELALKGVRGGSTLIHVKGGSGPKLLAAGKVGGTLPACSG